jgi:hypothetical protein
MLEDLLQAARDIDDAVKRFRAEVVKIDAFCTGVEEAAKHLNISQIIVEGEAVQIPRSVRPRSMEGS